MGFSIGGKIPSISSIKASLPSIDVKTVIPNLSDLKSSGFSKVSAELGKADMPGLSDIVGSATSGLNNFSDKLSVDSALSKISSSAGAPIEALRGLNFSSKEK